MKKEISVFLLFLILLSAGSAQKNGEDPFRIIKEGGIPVAINPDHPVPAEHGPRDILFHQELTLGTTGDDSHYLFGEFIRYAVDDQQNIYVLDRRSQAVRKFDSSGAYRLSFGRSGQGPGEFNDPEEIQLLLGGNLIVFEGENQRYSIFNQSGIYVGSGKFLKLMFSPYLGFSAGNFIATNIQFEANQRIITTAVYNKKSELLTLLHQHETAPDPPRPSQEDQESRAKRLADVFSRSAFLRTSVIALDRKEQIYFGFSDRFEIKVYSPEGKLRRVIRTALPLLPVSEQDRLDFLNVWLPKDLSTWRTMSETMRKKIKALIRFVKTKPAFLEIIPMDEDFVMVLREGQFGRNALIDIFDPQGRFIIEKRLLFPLKKGLCRDGKLYSLFEDDRGYQFVKRYDYRFQ
jgi:hypothetical protein